MAGRIPTTCTVAAVVTIAAWYAGWPTPAHAQNPAVTINVDVNANRRPINPDIYGVAHATTAQLNDLNSPLNRNGGNNTTRYNWQLNADNRGNDWYYQSIGDGSATAGERGDTFFARSRAANAKAMLTIPTIGWVAKVGAGRSKLASFSIAKYGRANRQRLAVVSRRGQRRPNQRPVRDRQRSERRERAVATQRSSGAGCSTWSTAGAPPRTAACGYYILDNEPSIWHATHRDVQPDGRDDGRGAGQDDRLRAG